MNLVFTITWTKLVYIYPTCLIAPTRGVSMQNLIMLVLILVPQLVLAQTNRDAFERAVLYSSYYGRASSLPDTSNLSMKTELIFSRHPAFDDQLFLKLTSLANQRKHHSSIVNYIQLKVVFSIETPEGEPEIFSYLGTEFSFTEKHLVFYVVETDRYYEIRKKDAAEWNQSHKNKPHLHINPGFKIIGKVNYEYRGPNLINFYQVNEDTELIDSGTFNIFRNK